MTQATNKKFPTSFRALENRAIIFLLINQKKPSGKAHARYEQYKTATSIIDAVNNGFTPLDMQYETKSNHRFKKFHTMCFIEGVNVNAQTKTSLETVIKENKNCIDNYSPTLQKKITENIKKFEKLIQAIK